MKALRVIVMVGLMLGAVIANAEALETVHPVTNELSGRVKVAILDSGSNIAYKEGVSLIDGTAKDYNGHGTLIAKIVKKVSPQAELYIIKVIGKDGLAVNEEGVILGLEWAISRDVDVINMSLRLKDSEKLHNVIKKAYNRGIVIVAAAGNKTSKIGTLTTKYDRRNMTDEIVYPAKYPEVVAVGAIDKYGKIYDASVKGKEVDVFCKGYKGRQAGTSIASAYAAGLAAKVISNNPNSDTQEIKNIIRQKASSFQPK